MNWPNPLCVIIQKNFKSKSNKTKNFVLWGKHSLKSGPMITTERVLPSTNVSTSLLQVSRNSVFCCSTVTANTPWFLHQKEIFNLLGSNFFPLCSLKLLHKVQLHEKVIPAKSHLRLSGLPESHACENTPHVFHYGLSHVWNMFRVFPTEFLLLLG